MDADLALIRGRQAKRISASCVRPEPTRPARPRISPWRTEHDTSVTPVARCDTFRRSVPPRREDRALGKDSRELAASHHPDERGAIDAGALAGFDRLPIAEDGDAIGNREDLLETMRDIDDAAAVRLEQPDDREQALDFAFGQRGRRLVHDDDLRVGADGLGDLDDLLLGHAERFDEARRIDRGADPAEELRRPALTCRPVQPPPRAAGFERHRDVLCDGQVGEERRLLVDGGDAERAGAAGIHRRHDVAVDDELAAIRRLGAGDDLDEGGFPRAVLTDEGVHFARTRSKETPLRARTPANALVMEAADRSMCGWAIHRRDDTTGMQSAAGSGAAQRFSGGGCRLAVDRPVCGDRSGLTRKRYAMRLPRPADPNVGVLLYEMAGGWAGQPKW